MLHQRQHRPFAVVQRDVIEEIENARLGQFAQFRVHEAAAQRRGNARVGFLDRLRDAERAVHASRKRNRDEHQVRPMRFQRRADPCAQDFVHERRLRRQRPGQRVEGRLAARQQFAVARELEARIDRVANRVGQIVQVERGQMLGPILRAQRAERPGQRIAVILRHEGIQIPKPRSLRQKAPRANPVRQGRILALQERHRCIDRIRIAVELLPERPHRFRRFLGPATAHPFEAGA